MANRDRNAVQNGLDDLLGNVIKGDRKTSGRVQKEIESPVSSDAASQNQNDMIGHINAEESDTMTLLHYDNMTGRQTNKQTDKETDKRTGDSMLPNQPGLKRTERMPDAESSTIERRLKEAVALAEGATMTVTLRIPAPLNEWLDEYVHRSWPNKIKKQELVIEALQIMFVRRGRPGEEIIETDLLPEKKKEK